MTQATEDLAKATLAKVLAEANEMLDGQTVDQLEDGEIDDISWEAACGLSDAELEAVGSTWFDWPDGRDTFTGRFSARGDFDRSRLANIEYNLMDWVEIQLTGALNPDLVGPTR